MTTSSNLLQEVDKILIATSKRAWEISGNTGDALIPKLHELQDFTSPQEGSDLAVIVSKSGDRYYVIDREDTSLFLLERTQQLKELREAPSKQWDVIHRASIQQMASLILFSQCFEIDPSLPKVDHSNQQIQNIMEIFETMIETSDRDLEGPRPFIPSEQRQDFEQQIQRELKQLKIESQHQAETLAAFWSGELSADHLNAISNFMIETRGEPTAERLLWLITTWAKKKGLPNPLIPLMQAWQQAKTAKRVTPEYDNKHPFSIITNSMGSIRDLNFVETGTAQLREFATPESIEQANPNQLCLPFAQDKPSILPAVMPLEVAHPMGLQEKTKAGAVSHEIRIFFEVLMALEPKQCQIDLMFRLGDLISYLYPDGKFHRTNQLPYIINALEVLHFYATVPWIDDQGSLRRWRPVMVKTPLEIDSTDDTPVFMSVDLPPDATRGYLIIKDTHRRLGKKSAPQFNAYHTAASLWDKHGTVKGKMINPTKPVERRDEEGYLIKDDATRILSSRGKPKQNLYDPDVVAQSDREDNPDTIKQYAVLSDNDLLAACNPNGYNGNKREVLRRAKKYWKALEKDGIISIREEPDGWRILPPDNHLKAYRAIRKASKRTVY